MFDGFEHFIIEAFKQSTVSGWLLCTFVLGALIKTWPIILVEANKAKAAMRGEKKDALDDCTKRLNAMDARLTALGVEMSQMQMRLMGAVTAYRILREDIIEHRPDSSAVQHAHLIFQQAMDGPLGDPTVKGQN